MHQPRPAKHPITETARSEVWLKTHQALHPNDAKLVLTIWLLLRTNLLTTAAAGTLTKLATLCTAKPFEDGQRNRLPAMAFISPLSTAFRTTTGPATTPRRPWRMSVTPPEEAATNTSSTPASQIDEGYELDTEAMKEKAMAVVSDVGERPLYYGKILGYAAGALVTITVLRAVVSAVDSIPVLPAALELVGLGYTAWFVWRYILFKESREELLEEIEEFLGRARPGQ